MFIKDVLEFSNLLWGNLELPTLRKPNCDWPESCLSCQSCLLYLFRLLCLRSLRTVHGVQATTSTYSITNTFLFYAQFSQSVLWTSEIIWVKPDLTLIHWPSLWQSFIWGGFCSLLCFLGKASTCLLRQTASSHHLSHSAMRPGYTLGSCLYKNLASKQGD